MYRSVECETWDDPWFSELEPLQKLVFLYLFTNRRIKSCGGMEITLKAISDETGIEDRATVSKILASLGNKIQWNEADKSLFVVNFYAHQSKNAGATFRTAALRSLKELPIGCAQSFIARYRDTVDADTLSKAEFAWLIPYTHPMHTLCNNRDTVGDTLGGSETGTVTEAENSKQDSPQTPQGDGDDTARQVYTELKGSKRTFPPSEPPLAQAIAHLLWRVEMSNQALTPPSAMGREVKAASDMLALKYTEDEILQHYEYQRDRSEKGYSLHLLTFAIGSLHKRKPGETAPPSWMNAKARPNNDRHANNQVDINAKYAHLKPSGTG